MKHSIPLILMIVIALLLSACGQQNNQDVQIAVSVALTQTAAAQPAKPAASATPAAAANGTISGVVYLIAPPTPHMVVNAVDTKAKRWAFTETAATDGEASFSISVPEGVYQLYAFTDNGGYTGYSLDGTTLAFVSIAANQTITGIKVTPPSQSDCGAMFGVPASPDGRFKAVPGPSPDCLAKLATPEAAPQAPPTNPADATRIQFKAGSISWNTANSLIPHGNTAYVLNAREGQQMLVQLLTVPDSASAPTATIYVWGADGTVLSTGTDPIQFWGGLLPSSQDYYIGVASMSGESVNYTLQVTIPVLPSNSSAKGSYVPVPQNVCEILAEEGGKAISNVFTMTTSASFTDPIKGEKGSGCNLTAGGTGKQYSDPNKVISKLMQAYGGWEELPNYQAGGPTGAATGMKRDMALMLIGANWKPADGANCPSDQPISACNLKPEQKIWTITVQAAMK
jgi:hypothetical protein